MTQTEVIFLLFCNSRAVEVVVVVVQRVGYEKELLIHLSLAASFSLLTILTATCVLWGVRCQNQEKTPQKKQIPRRRNYFLCTRSLFLLHFLPGPLPLAAPVIPKMLSAALADGRRAAKEILRLCAC